METPMTRPHWTAAYQFRNVSTAEVVTAADIYANPEHATYLRKTRYGLINALLHDVIRLEDGSRWERIA